MCATQKQRLLPFGVFTLNSWLRSGSAQATARRYGRGPMETPNFGGGGDAGRPSAGFDASTRTVRPGAVDHDFVLWSQWFWCCSIFFTSRLACPRHDGWSVECRVVEQWAWNGTWMAWLRQKSFLLGDKPFVAPTTDDSLIWW